MWIVHYIFRAAPRLLAALLAAATWRADVGRRGLQHQTLGQLWDLIPGVSPISSGSTAMFHSTAVRGEGAVRASCTH
jgi:hypothetical protein